MENIETDLVQLSIECIDNTDKEKDTLILSGGGIKGLYILGGVQCLYDTNKLNNINNFIGTSVGSIISYLLVIGYTPVEIVSYICSHKVLNRLSMFDIKKALRGEGALSFSIFSEVLEEMTIDKIGILLTMGTLREKFNKNLVCCTYNITHNKPEYISYENYPEMPCITALKMSCSIPLIFQECKYKDSYYVDGALYDNFAYDYGLNLSKNSIGIKIDEKGEIKRLCESNLFEYLYKMTMTGIYNKNHIPNKLLDIITIDTTSEINCINFSITTSQILDMFSDGYQQTLKSII